MPENILIPERCMGLNPILLGLNAMSSTEQLYMLYHHEDAEPFYYGSVTGLSGYIYVDLAEFFKSEARVAGVQRIQIYSNYGDDADSIRYFTVYGGGISKLLQRKLAAAGTDIFNWKLKNVNANFLLTTRTSGRIIRIPEDELMPLPYYAQGLSFMIKAGGETLATYNHSTDTEETLQTIDFQALRLEAMTAVGKLLSAFDLITSQGGYACSVVITEVPTKNSYFLRFLNSWGVFEKISIQGLIAFEPTFSEMEQVARFDSVVQTMVNLPQRRKLTPNYKASVGYKNANERLFLLDALLSDECYLIANGMECRVKISTNSTLFSSTDEMPTDIELTIEMIDTEESYNSIMVENDNVLVTSNNEIVTINGFNILT